MNHLCLKFLNQLDHDSKEKVLTSIATLIDDCREDFKLHIFHKLNKLKDEYQNLNKEETDSGETYFYDILQLIENMLLKLKVKQEL